MHTLDPVNYVTQLKTTMKKLQPPSVRRHQQRKTHIHKDLHTCPFVFVRNDTVKKPLQPPYDGPFKVLHRTDKHFTVDIAGKKKVISLDRLKTADNSSLPTEDSTSTDTTTSTDDTILHRITTHYHQLQLHLHLQSHLHPRQLSELPDPEDTSTGPGNLLTIVCFPSSLDGEWCGIYNWTHQLQLKPLGISYNNHDEAS